MSEKNQDTKNQDETRYERTLGRTLARELTNEDLEEVVGGAGNGGLKVDYTPTGNPEADCD